MKTLPTPTVMAAALSVAAQAAAPSLSFNYEVIAKGWEAKRIISATVVGQVTEQFSKTTYVVDLSVPYCYDKKNYPQVHPVLGYQIYNNASYGWHNGENGPCHAIRTGPVVDNTSQWFPVYVGPSAAASDSREYSRTINVVFDGPLTSAGSLKSNRPVPLGNPVSIPTIGGNASAVVTAGEDIAFEVPLGNGPTSVDLNFEPVWMDLRPVRGAGGAITSVRLTGKPSDNGFPYSVQAKLIAENSAGETSRWLTFSVKPAHEPIVITVPTTPKPTPEQQPALPPLFIPPEPQFPPVPEVTPVPPQNRPVMDLGPAAVDEIQHNRTYEEGNPDGWFKEVPARRDYQLLVTSKNLGFDIFFSAPFESIATANGGARVIARPREKPELLAWQRTEHGSGSITVDQGEQLVGVSALAAPDSQTTYSVASDNPCVRLRMDGNLIYASVFDTNAPIAPLVELGAPVSYRNQFALAWSSADDCSGVHGFLYSIDGGPQTFTEDDHLAGALAPSVGEHTLRVSAVDWANNISEPKAVAFTYLPLELAATFQGPGLVKFRWPKSMFASTTVEQSLDLKQWSIVTDVQVTIEDPWVFYALPVTSGTPNRSFYRARFTQP